MQWACSFFYKDGSKNQRKKRKIVKHEYVWPLKNNDLIRIFRYKITIWPLEQFEKLELYTRTAKGFSGCTTYILILFICNCGCDSRGQVFLKNNFYHGYIILLPQWTSFSLAPTLNKEVLPQTKMESMGVYFLLKIITY